MQIIYLKKESIRKARSYIYKLGETEQISRNKFERALIDNDFRDFPNVSYFYKLKL
jgi:hypothetical protein